MNTHITLLGIYPKDLVQYHTDTCSFMFIAVLFNIARNWKHPRCVLSEQLMKKMWFIYTIGYYSAIEFNNIMKFVVKWMERENIIPV